MGKAHRIGLCGTFLLNHFNSVTVINRSNWVTVKFEYPTMRSYFQKALDFSHNFSYNYEKGVKYYEKL